ncbi:MAG: hypothetical protein KAI53_04390 [Candidatus Aenigmarchaeota archaeon]|nr:hypothetical protein [Candidatus Aenigmarchaeota archaeon]
MMKNTLVKIKIAMDRGKYWLSYVQFFMLLFVLVTSMKQYTTFSFFRSTEWLGLLTIITLVGLVVLGYIDLKVLKTYQTESEIYARVNPIQKKMLDNQENILKQLDLLEKQGNK